MANVKNFGLVGVGTTVQFGKAGPSLGQQTASILKADGTAAFRLPAGTTAEQPVASTAGAGGMRFNSTSGSMEFSNGTAWVSVATGGEAVTAVTGTTDRITSTGGLTPVIDIASTYVGQASITTLGTVTTGTWNADVIAPAYGGTGVANTNTITLGGDVLTAGSFTTVGANALTLTTTGATSLTLPESGTLLSTANIAANAVTSFSAGTTGFTPSTDTAGVVTLAGVLVGANGGTGVDNGSNTITLGGNISTAGALTTAGAFTTVGAFGTTLTATGTTALTLPTSGTLATTANVQTVQDEVDAIEGALGAGITSAGVFDATPFAGGPAAAATSFTEAITLSAGTAGTALQSVDVTSSSSGLTVTPGGVALDPTFDLTLDAGLQALAVKTSTGITVQTGDNTYEARTLVAPAAGITITDADGVAGNPTFALANDLAALEGLATTGIIVRTGDGTATTRTITGTATRIEVANGDGVGASPTIDLSTVTQAATGDFVKVTLDGYGRVTGNTAVVTADITALVDGTYVNVSGDTMTGNLNMGGFTVSDLAEPTAGTDAATKNYVDNAVTGLTWKTAVLVATTANITLSGEQTIDGVLTSGSRVLVKNQTDPTENGIYVSAAGAWARSTDANTGAELDSASVFVQQGTTNADSGWVQTTSNVVIGTSNIVWTQFSGAGAYTGGTGIDITGNVISAKLGAGITNLPTGEIGLDVAADKAVQLTSELAGGQLTLVLSGSSLTQSAAGLAVNAAGVTNAMLSTGGTITLDTDGAGTGNVSLGETLNIFGTSLQGISTTLSGQTVTITASDASSSQKGVATFSTDSFVVTSGDVAIKTAGVTNAQLVNSTFTLTGNSGSDAVALGETLAVTGSGAISTAVTGNDLAISVASATTTTLGVASFSATNFDVTAGAVSIKAGGVNLTTDVTGTLPVANGGTGAVSFTAGQLIFGNGTSALAQDADLAFDATTNTLTVGTATLAGTAGGDVTLTATATDGDIVLVPNGTGSVVVGPAGAGLIQSDAGQTLTVTGATGLTLGSTAGSTTMALAAGTTAKVTVTGPTAAQYATDLADADLTNKNYVDAAIAASVVTGNSGDVKAVQATFSLAAGGTFNIGAAMPAGATVLSVKANVTAADTATGTLSVGKSGIAAAYMTTSENDTQTTGLYLAETMVTEAASEQVIGTVAGTPGGTGSVTVVVTYQLA